jgi:hypothetical protein
LWVYETMESPSKVYILGSFWDPSTNRWKLYYQRIGNTSTWQPAGTIRSLANSTRPHEVTFSRGLAFVKSFPDPSSSDKYGTSILDGTAGTITARLWGLPAPTIPARITGRVTYLANTIDAVQTTLNVTANFSPPLTAPFTIQIDRELMSVTSTGGGTNWTVVRGINGTVATPHDAGQLVLYRGWSTSAHRVDVNFTWQYSYAWKSVTGHISNRAPLETNPDLLPSSTGPFFDLIPSITVQGHADTTNITHIVIFRTSDGGGTFYELDTIPNTGAGNITYLDTKLESGPTGGVFNDPIPDVVLQRRAVAPSLVSNSPPPTTLAPKVTGVDPVEPATPLVTFAGRIWYAIGNVLFYSAGSEEIQLGIPEESFPTGLTGNFYRLELPIQNLFATDNALFVFTQRSIHVVTGNNRETFNLRPLYDEIGTPAGHPRAVIGRGKAIYFLTQDFRVAVIEGDAEPTIVSDPLFTDLIDHYNIEPVNMEFELKYWGDLEKDWLIVSGHNKLEPGLSKHWVLDLKKTQGARAFWFVPWLISSTAVLSSHISELQRQRRLCFWIFDQTIPYGRLVRIDSTGRHPTDVTVNSTVSAGITGIDFYVDINLHRNPAGNHVNMLRVPGLTPVVQYVVLERTITPGDDDPEIYYYTDDFWSNPQPVLYLEDPARREQSTAYKTICAQIDTVAYRFSFRIQYIKSDFIIEIHSYAIIWTPESGA